MTKYIMLPVLFIYLSIVTLVANSLAISSSDIGLAIPEGNSQTVGDYLGIFWDMLTFEIEIPSILIIIFIYPAIIVILFFLIEIFIELGKIIAEAIPL